MEKPIADVYLAKWHANFFYLSKSPLKKFFACEIAITNYYDMSNYYDVRIKGDLRGQVGLGSSLLTFRQAGR